MKFKTVFWSVFLVGVFGYFFYKIGKRAISDYFLKAHAVYTKGVIIDEKNYLGNTPVSHEWSYSYLFVVGSKTYTNDAIDPDAKLGDSVDVKYVKGCPSLNRPVHPKY